MSKVKPPKSKGIPSKHLHARSTFLYQAASYLTLQAATSVTASTSESPAPNQPSKSKHCSTGLPSPLALQLGSDLQQVSRKAQLRLSLDLKRSLCKSCNTILVSGRTAIYTIENTSKGSKKPWADVLVIECTFCSGKKRFPVGALRQQKKCARKPGLGETKSTASLEEKPQSGHADLMTTDIEEDTG